MPCGLTWVFCSWEQTKRGLVMSKTTLGIFIAAIVLIIAATAMQATFVAGGAGVVLMVGLIYSYVIAQRDQERANGDSSDPAE